MQIKSSFSFLKIHFIFHTPDFTMKNSLLYAILCRFSQLEYRGAQGGGGGLRAPSPYTFAK